MTTEKQQHPTPKDLTIRLPGREDGQASPPPAEGQVEIRSKQRIRLGAARDMGGVVELEHIQRDDVASVEFSDGFKLPS
jgi:hypothetical protein